ncbi:uncharacterized protein LOC109364801 [Meleagris gallopavo]|uniref:uncharacterized protein LOC109364264 n=1 Tax=Meleagris gallopavo TaxID=9103 RepID=UPI00093B952F|nr:uncharacterized protein LOC109364264 [Meleagris gallopavo]XP_019466952.1 uncharacterized protein LOC109364801 [Meleagris gallopavo]
MEAELDTRCPICLENWDSVAYTMPCCHQFCFPCIEQWTRIRLQCPLCKRGVQSIIHTVQADDDFKELVFRPDAGASTATWDPTVNQEVWPRPEVPRRLLGGLSPDTWATVFRDHPALLQPLWSWLRRKLHRILGNDEIHANILAQSVIWALLHIGLEEEVLVETLDSDLEGRTVTFVQQFIAFTVRRCGREAHRRLGLNVPPAAGAEEANSASQPRAAPGEEAAVPGPAPSSNPASPIRGEMPGGTAEELSRSPSRSHSNRVTGSAEQAVAHEVPEEPVAGPSGTSPPEGNRRAPKRKANSQASESPKKRPPRRQE